MAGYAEDSFHVVQAERKVEWTGGAIESMEYEVMSVLMELEPTADEMIRRKMVIQSINRILHQKFPCLELHVLGSHAMGTAFYKSDLDLSLEYMPGNMHSAVSYGLPPDLLAREGKQGLLRKVCKVLRESGGNVTDVAPVYNAKVPIVKCRDVKWGIECDISVCNWDGEFRSRFLQIIFRIDVRFRMLCFLVKSWAQKAKINEAKNGTINSISLTLLVAVHLQTRTPPILPPFSTFRLPHSGHGNWELHPISREVMESCLASAEMQVDLLIRQGFHRRNTSTISELLVSFFAQFSEAEYLSEMGMCASAYCGKWITKDWDPKQTSPLLVEDFVERNVNSARNVRGIEQEKIFKLINETNEDLLSIASLSRPPRNVIDRLFLPSNSTNRRSLADRSSVLGKRPRMPVAASPGPIVNPPHRPIYSGTSINPSHGNPPRVIAYPHPYATVRAQQAPVTVVTAAAPPIRPPQTLEPIAQQTPSLLYSQSVPSVRLNPPLLSPHSPSPSPRQHTYPSSHSNHLVSNSVAPSPLRSELSQLFQPSHLPHSFQPSQTSHSYKALSNPLQTYETVHKYAIPKSAINPPPPPPPPHPRPHPHPSPVSTPSPSAPPPPARHIPRFITPQPTLPFSLLPRPPPRPLAYVGTPSNNMWSPSFGAGRPQVQIVHSSNGTYPSHPRGNQNSFSLSR